ncbi:unnamed protein product, partial [Laminaria digitata]
PRSVTAATTDAPSAIENQEILHCAASQGIVLSLSALPAGGGFSYDLRDRFGRTPLHWAAEQGHRNVVLALVRAGASVDPRSQRNATPIMLAASRGHDEVVRLLVRYRAGESDCQPMKRNHRNIEHWRTTAFHCAAAGGHVGVVELLLDAGFDRGQRDGKGVTPAEVSARTSHSTSPTVTNLLLPSDKGAKMVYSYNRNGETPLRRAVHSQYVAISKVLLLAGADPDLRDRRGTSPLHVAACTGCGEILADLLKAGAEVGPRRNGGWSSLRTDALR